MKTGFSCRTALLVWQLLFLACLCKKPVMRNSAAAQGADKAAKAEGEGELTLLKEMQIKSPLGKQRWLKRKVLGVVRRRRVDGA